jgi:hypothetical protein
MIEASLDQKTIDILLTCRKAIDDARIAKQEAHTQLKTITESKVGILSSGITAEQAASKEDYQIMQDSFTTSRNTYLAILVENGFKSVEDFFKFNDDMCLVAIRECVPIEKLEGNCNLCEGLEEPVCMTLGVTQKGYTPSPTSQSCYYSPQEGKRPADSTSWDSMLLNGILRKGFNFETGKDGRVRIVCPQYSFASGIVKPFPFDLYWR